MDAISLAICQSAAAISRATEIALFIFIILAYKQIHAG